MRHAAILSRRRLLANATGLAVATVVPPHVLGGPARVPPSEQLRVAVMGTGGQGITNIKALLQHPDVRITAICDPAEFWDNSKLYYRHHGGRGPALEALKEHFREAGSGGRAACAVYEDFRVMLEKGGKDLDAVLIAAPNHIHAVASVAAMQAGKHVYCEKPLTRTVYEARRVAAAAREAGVATQMGNHGHSSDDIRRAVEWIRDGAIGKVREVHGWRGGARRMTLTSRPTETPPLPDGLNWDLWLGPAPERPFHPAYAPLLFHYWWDFGTGTLGNYGCHTLDTAAWALELGHPTMIEASSSELNDETTPAAAMYHYRFGPRGRHPEVDLFWYDGGLMPPRPECLEPDRDLPRIGGLLIVGDQGAILSGSWSGSPRIIPEQKMREYRRPSQTIPRSQGHHRDWINACKGGPPASSNFDYGAHLTELVLLGAVALRTQETIYWDGPNMRAINTPKAEPLIHGYFRKAWEI